MPRRSKKAAKWALSVSSEDEIFFEKLRDAGKPAPILDDRPELPAYLQSVLDDWKLLRAATAATGYTTPVSMRDIVAYAEASGILVFDDWLELILVCDAEYLKHHRAKEKKT